MTFKRPSCATCGIISVLLAMLAVGGIMLFVWVGGLTWLFVKGTSNFGSPIAREVARDYPYQVTDHTPRWSADGRYLVASAGRSIYQVDLHDGTVQAILEGKDREYYAPSLSPDGRVAYIEFNPERLIGRIMVKDLEGRSRSVGEWPDGSPVEWSPDGSHLLYTGWYADLGAVAVLRTAAGAEVKWPVRYVSRTSASWSPDSRQVLFHYESTHDSQVPYVAYVVDWDGTGDRTIAQSEPPRDSESRISRPGWTADGRIYYVERERSGDEWENILYAVNGDGRERRALANLSKIAAGMELPSQVVLPLADIREVKPSPDGSMALLFASNRISDHLGETRRGPARLYMLSLDDRSLREISVTGNVGGAKRISASWSPNGEQLAVYVPYLLFTESAEGSGQRILLTASAAPDSN